MARYCRMAEMHKKSSDLHNAGLASSNSALKCDWQTPFAVILLFLVLIVPLRQLADKIAELQRQSDDWLATTSQARLNEELVQFKKDLSAEAWVKNFVDSRLEKLDLASAFRDLTVEESPYLRSQALNNIYFSVKKALEIGAAGRRENCCNGRFCLAFIRRQNFSENRRSATDRQY